MKKIILIITIALSAISCKSQNFFWSHTQSYCTYGYGLLYNWYAATDSRKISSSDDWVIPTDLEWDALITYLGGTTLAGGPLKETGLTYWNPNTGATNSTGFNGRGSGYRKETGEFVSINTRNEIWASNQYPFAPFSNANYIYLNGSGTDSNTPTGGVNKTFGLSVRLRKQATGVPDGVTVFYTGNDGKRYTAISINGYYYLQYSLAETKFRNGDIIPWYGANPANYFTNSEWAALTTAGCCAYNNDVSKVGCNFQFP